MNKVMGGSVVVSMVVLVKLLAKTALFGAIFGTAFGGARYTKSENEMSVTNIKNEAEYMTTHKGKYSDKEWTLDDVFVDEDRRRLVFSIEFNELTNEMVKAVDVSARRDVVDELNDRLIMGLKSDKNTRNLFKHDWEVEYRFLTNEKLKVIDTVITKYDVLAGVQ